MDNKPPELETLFLAALEIDAAARSAFLDQSCGEDQQLRDQVEQLLESHREAGSFLEQPADGVGRTIDFDPDVLEAGLSATFGADAAVVIGNAGHSVLKSFGKTLPDVPQVMLRDAGDEGEPITQPRSSEVPRSDSRYQLLGEIARGGMGAILKGRDMDLGRDLAIKVLLDAHKSRPEMVQRFLEEAQIGGQLQHPGIAPVYELGQFADQRPFFSMKLVKGKTLSVLLAERQVPADEPTSWWGPLAKCR